MHVLASSTVLRKKKNKGEQMGNLKCFASPKGLSL